MRTVGWQCLLNKSEEAADNITGGDQRAMNAITETHLDPMLQSNVNRKKEKGVTTVEYAVMLVLVAIAVLAFGKGIANSVTGVFSTLASSLK
jgi:Flp pilus assembly pilin Flp